MTILSIMLIILSRKAMRKENVCKDVIIQPKKKIGWMTSQLMEDWLGCVRECRPGALSKQWGILATDVFRGHLSDRIRNRIRNKNTDIVIIPSGMRCQLQTLDLLINKPFKHLVFKHYDAWLNRNNHVLTPSGKLKRDQHQ
jgi:hypothetical protein